MLNEQIQTFKKRRLEKDENVKKLTNECKKLERKIRDLKCSPIEGGENIAKSLCDGYVETVPEIERFYFNLNNIKLLLKHIDNHTSQWLSPIEKNMPSWTIKLKSGAILCGRVEVKHYGGIFINDIYIFEKEIGPLDKNKSCHYNSGKTSITKIFNKLCSRKEFLSVLGVLNVACFVYDKFCDIRNDTWHIFRKVNGYYNVTEDGPIFSRFTKSELKTIDDLDRAYLDKYIKDV